MIQLLEFLSFVILIADRKLNKINTLALQGPPSTGKSLMLSALLDPLHTAIVTRNGDQNTFHLQNFLGKAYAKFEEPRITKTVVDNYKLLFLGIISVLMSRINPLRLLIEFPSLFRPTKT